MCCKSAKTVSLVVGGVVVAAVVAAAVWTLFAHRREDENPLDEADRRIRELEHSLHRLRDVITHTTE
jgi:hypothetical protein